MYVDIWDRIRVEMARQKLTAEQLAEIAGVKKNTLNGWLYKRVMPKADEAVCIAVALNTSVEHLIMGETPPSWYPSPRIKPIIDDLLLLTDNELAPVAIMVRSLADIHRSGSETRTQAGA